MLSSALLYLVLVGVMVAFALYLIVHYRVSALSCLLLFACVLPVEFALEQSVVERGEQRAKLAATNELHHIGQRLTGLLGSHLAAVEGLAAYIAANPNLTQEEFDRFSKTIMHRQKHLINVAAAPNLVVNMIYPLAGNEEALGLNYLQTESQRQAVLRARDTQEAVLAGPLELVQGGVALIGRLPVYVDREDGTRVFWGIVSATMDAQKVFNSAGLMNTSDGLNLAIRGVDGQGSRGAVFFGSADTFSARDATYLPIPVASGNWVLVANSLELETLQQGIWFVRCVALLVIFGWLIALLLRKRISLNKRFYEQRIRAGDQLLQEAGKLAGVAGWKLDEEARLVHFSEEFAQLVGLPQFDSAAPEHIVSMLSLEAQEELNRAVRGCFTGQKPFDLELPLERKAVTHWLRIIGNPVLLDGKVVEVVGAVQDVTERREFVQTIERQATRDALTGLPNRQQFDAFLQTHVALASRHKQSLSVLFIDLDEFKAVNDNLGHSGGDELLVEAATRIKACTRKSDIVARLSGDEFAIILPDIAHPTAASIVAAKVVAAMNQPFEIYSKQVFISASVGAAVFPEDGADADTLLINADQAMYEVKKSLRNDFVFFTPELQRRSEDRHRLFNKLSLAITEKRLEVHYQPIVPIDGSGRVACEALVRWQEDGVYISADSFIPLAEETGLITEIDRFVMEQATAYMECLRAQGLKPPALSVNVSPRIFFDRGGELERWIENVKLCARRTELTVEITERLLTQDTPKASGVLQQLRADGVKIAIDDFGTGYSSLSYLAKFPIDTLKVDAFFVSKIPDDSFAVTLTETILGLSRELSLHTVAEGVETAEQLRFLEERGCHSAQGYWLSKPLPAEAFNVWLVNYRASITGPARQRTAT